ncbi:MAG: exosortase family protein XrtF [Leeuwenhoekiella sp.]
MINYLRKYKSVLRFILTFLGTYLLLSLVYMTYLKVGSSTQFYPDYITHEVALQCRWLVEKMGFNAVIEPHETEASMKLFVENYFVVRVVEGCNSASIIILFAAFVLSFFKGYKRTLLFIFLGSISIYVINIIRIAIIAIALYKYPQYAEFLHSIVFPAVIYGYIFLLWVLWVVRLNKKNHA